MVCSKKKKIGLRKHFWWKKDQRRILHQILFDNIRNNYFFMFRYWCILFRQPKTDSDYRFNRYDCKISVPSHHFPFLFYIIISSFAMWTSTLVIMTSSWSKTKFIVSCYQKIDKLSLHRLRFTFTIIDVRQLRSNFDSNIIWSLVFNLSSQIRIPLKQWRHVWMTTNQIEPQKSKRKLNILTI